MRMKLARTKNVIFEDGIDQRSSENVVDGGKNDNNYHKLLLFIVV